VSFELTVRGGRTASIEQWQLYLMLLGVKLEFDPRFVLETHYGTMPARLEIANRNLFPLAREFITAGPLRADFEFTVEQLGPCAQVDEAALARLRRGIATLVEINSAQMIIDEARAKVASIERGEIRTEQRAWFRTAAGRSGASLVAQIIAAATYAIAAKATLEDPQLGDGFENGVPLTSTVTAIRTMLARQLREHVWYEDVGIGQPFTTW